MDIKILVAVHKKYWMPDDAMYLPIHVGAEGKTDEKGNPLDLGYVKDNTGDNISRKNKNYRTLSLCSMSSKISMRNSKAKRMSYARTCVI